MTEPPTMHQLKIWLQVHSNIEQQIQSAVRLAGLLNTKLVAEFYEDQALIAAAELPFVNEVLLWTAKEKETSPSLLSQATRVQANRAEAILTEAAEKEKIPYSFSKCRQRSLDPEANPKVQTIYWIGGRWTDFTQLNKSIYVLEDSSAAGKRCVAIAAEVATQIGSPLQIIAVEVADTKVDNESLLSPSLNRKELAPPRFTSLDDFWKWLNSDAGIPCFALFISIEAYEKIKENQIAHIRQFPYLVV